MADEHDDFESLPPTARARMRLLFLIKNSDDQGNACQFDPWPLAEVYAQLRADASNENWGRLQPHFRELGDKCSEADKAWTGSFMRRPRMQTLYAEKCLEWRSSIEAGDGAAIMEALAVCASHGLVIPGWLAAAFVERYERVMHGDCKGWSDAEAFGSVLPSGWNVAGLRARKHDAPWAYEVALLLLEKDPHQALDQAFYEQVGKEIKRGHSRTQDLIRIHLEQSEKREPPLSYVRDRLQHSGTLGDALMAWHDESWEAFHDATRVASQRETSDMDSPREADPPKKL